MFWKTWSVTSNINKKKEQWSFILQYEFSKQKKDIELMQIFELDKMCGYFV